MQSVPFVFYCHPYEFDPHEFKEISLHIPLRVRLHQGLGRNRFGKRFEALLRRFSGRPVRDLLLSYKWPDLAIESMDGQFPNTTGSGISTG
jgi:hypothetical protein